MSNHSESVRSFIARADLRRNSSSTTGISHFMVTLIVRILSPYWTDRHRTPEIRERGAVILLGISGQMLIAAVKMNYPKKWKLILKTLIAVKNYPILEFFMAFQCSVNMA
ncbi:unnamed protein product [Linum trigynum]|uniref:Uncharacterized protein n=1 Tax=Linum trigynum TaxID=586398 RepID=A0AAV2CTY2_9ROSI